MLNLNKVVITGIGVVSSFGSSAKQFWQAISQGQSAVKAWQPQGLTDFPVQYAATIDWQQLQDSYSAELADAPLLERRGSFGLLAAIKAYQDAGLNTDLTTGVATCSGVPEISELEMQALDDNGAYPQALEAHQPTSHSGLAVSNDAMVATIAQQLNMQGPVLNINGACAGAAQAIGMAYQAIQRGEVDAMLAGGADSVANTRVMTGLFKLGATATSSPRGDKLCCPFDQARSGLVAGEGGAFLVLESEASALARGATIYAEMTGYGCSMDGYKVTAPHPEGEGAIRAMRAALDDANLDTVDYINAHGTSTPLNDEVETKAIKQIFAADQLPLVSATKSMIGHWISAAAAPEAIATVLALHHQIVPPTINLQIPDQACDLDYVADNARETELSNAMSNSFGFGGINACLVFARYQTNQQGAN